MNANRVLDDFYRIYKGIPMWTKKGLRTWIVPGWY